ncbi:TPA: hypothetical protein N0F65_012237 [Lagenidium giganteum]|uniref:Uncharacterized protein n=1 Tax=Lagenidium giganteum TaxID=4803 RepID=A0AAV2ZIR9_9STRA|nr:TPA: hypothetical protein N0F65_012237 [Lagenidium giganteum]
MMKRVNVLDGRNADIFGVAGGAASEALQALDVVDADGGETFSIAVIADGSVVGWGSSFHGEVLAWGSNAAGQLGIGVSSTSDVAVPAVVAMPSDVAVTSVAAGGMHSLALDSTGAVWSWGDNSYGQLGLEVDDKSRHAPSAIAVTIKSPAQSIAAGWGHSALVADNGSAVYTFGWGLYHQLGHGTTASASSPTCVDALAGLDGQCSETQTQGILQVQCGNWHTAVLTASGDVYVWGWSEAGQLGPTSRKSEPLPRVVDTSDGYFSADIPGHEAIAITCGARSTAVLCRNGDLHWWGRRRRNELEQGELELPRSSNGRVVRLAAGHSHLLLLSTPRKPQ